MKHMLTAGTATAGSLTNWLRDLMGGPDFDTLEKAEALPGCRSEPRDCWYCRTWPASARRCSIPTRVVWLPASLCGTSVHICFRAAYEGIAFGIRQILDLFDESAPHVMRTVAVGGGVNSRCGRPSSSDVAGRTQLIPRGDHWRVLRRRTLAAIGIGLVDPKTDWTVIDHKVELTWPAGRATRSSIDCGGSSIRDQPADVPPRRLGQTGLSTGEDVLRGRGIGYQLAEELRSRAGDDRRDLGPSPTATTMGMLLQRLEVDCDQPLAAFERDHLPARLKNREQTSPTASISSERSCRRTGVLRIAGVAAHRHQLGRTVRAATGSAPAGCSGR